MDLYLDNSNVIELRALTNSLTNEPVTDATVTVTLKAPDGEDVSGDAWPKAMPHDSGGTYRATLSANVDIEVSNEYLAIIDASGPGGEIGHWECIVTAMYRRCAACA